MVKTSATSVPANAGTNAPPAQSNADWPTRLRDPAPAVRRVAILDAARTGTPQSAAALLDHLATERDPKARLLAIRALATTAFAPAMPALARLRANPATSPQESHAALLAHDAIEFALRPAQTAHESDAEPESAE
jgi:HEAT repeat protein